MWQAKLFDDEFDEAFSASVVNVASVPKLSPFRYPGGKTWFIPYLRQWLSPHVRQKQHLTPVAPEHFIEPFLGGGSMSLTVASERLAKNTTMVEIDADVAAVWHTVLNREDGEWLANRIVSIPLTTENIGALLNAVPTTVRERAFQTIVKNRVYRGGILAPGSGLMKLGEAGKGLLSRWYPATLAKRIRHILTLRDSLTFLHDDGLAILAAHINNPHAVFFLDPPYTAGKHGKQAGKRLYTHSELDHEQLFDYASHIRGDFLMTYDNSEEVRGLARRYGFDMRLVPMKSTHHVNMSELVIGQNLQWLRMPRS
jgi:DNA adenine methylase